MFAKLLLVFREARRSLHASVEFWVLLVCDLSRARQRCSEDILSEIVLSLVLDVRGILTAFNEVDTATFSFRLSVQRI